MLVLKNQKFTLTLVTYIVLALTLVEASSHSFGGVSRREHSNLKRMVKKRSPMPQTTKEDQNLAADVLDIPVVGAANDPESVSSSSASSSASSASSSSASASASASVSSTASVSASLSASASASASASQSSSSSSSSATPPAEIKTPEIPASQSTVVLFSTADAAQETSINNNISGAAKQQSKSTILTVLIVVASCIGGITLLWTIFRKWKLRRSKQFDQRLQPIDWQPTSHDEGDDIIPANRRLSGASFRSANGARNYGSASDAGHGSSEHGTSPLQPLPDHDFTAGPSLAPVGGYADLARGPSPQPQMTERAAAMTRSGYDANVPLHHQGYGSQDAYGGARY